MRLSDEQLAQEAADWGAYEAMEQTMLDAWDSFEDVLYVSSLVEPPPPAADYAADWQDGYDAEEAYESAREGGDWDMIDWRQTYRRHAHRIEGY